MNWIKPKESIGYRTVKAGTFVQITSTHETEELGFVIVATKLTETIDKDLIEDGASPPPDTSSWESARLVRDVVFELDSHARGQIQNELGDGLVAVNFSFVAKIVDRGDVVIQRHEGTEARRHKAKGRVR